MTYLQVENITFKAQESTSSISIDKWQGKQESANVL